MEELLKKLTESELLDEATRASIEEAFSQKLEEMRSEAEAVVREEFAKKYKADRDKLIIACEMMIRDNLAKELKEFSEDHAQQRKITARAAKAIAEADARANKKLKKQIKVLETMVRENLAKEIKEFAEDRKVERTAVLKSLKEAKARAERDRQAFIARGAKVLETIVEKQLREKLTVLESDIKEARKNDFGRRLFEAFAADYRTTWFNENAEAKKVARKLAEATKRIQVLEAKHQSEKKALVESLKKERAARQQLNERRERTTIMENLLSRLDGSAKAEMKQLLEAAPTHKLKQTFKRYLPIVAEKARTEMPRKSVLKESLGRMRTGDKTTSDPSLDAEIAQMAKNAGLKIAS